MVNKSIESEIAGITRFLSNVSVDCVSGRIYWVVSRKGTPVGKEAGTLQKSGYTAIQFDGKKYYRHRIIFYVSMGYLPEIVDHKRGVENGDGIDNLQEATNQQNCQKQKKRKSNTSGYRGVDIHKASGKYRAQIRMNGKKKYLGLFDTPEEARDKYIEKAKELFGEFYNGD
nr:MAG TPA: endonuclease [Caudoviricetes sp.]